MPKNKPAFTDTQLLDALERDIRECGGLTLWVADTAADEFPGGPRGLLFGKLHRGRSLRRSLEVIARREGKQDEALKALKESAESKVQRLTEELSERNSYIANYEHATQIERAERDTELSALRAELAEAKDTLKEHEEEHWCFNAEHGRVIIERYRLRAELAQVRVRLEEAERERGKEFYFRFPKSLDLCGPYRSIEEMREDSAWKHPAWTPVWRLKGLAPGPYHEFDRDAAISQTAQPEEKR